MNGTISIDAFASQSRKGFQHILGQSIKETLRGKFDKCKSGRVGFIAPILPLEHQPG